MSSPRCLAVILSLFVPVLAEAAAVPSGSEAGKAALDKARAAYREAGAFRETLEATLELPDGRKEPRQQEYGVGKGGEAFLTLSSNGEVIFRIVARDGRM